MNSKFAALLSVILAAALSGCDTEPQTDLRTKPSQKPLKVPKAVAIDLSQLCSDISVPDYKGDLVTGTRDCDLSMTICESVGDTNCIIQDDSLYGIAPKDLIADNIKAGVEINGVVGRLVTDSQTCTSEGQSLCIATAALPAAAVQDVAKHVIKGQNVGSYAGGFEPDFPEPESVLTSATTNGRPGTISSCGNSRQSSCLLAPSQAATAIAGIVPANIKEGETIGGVLGTFKTAAATCATDGASNCLVTGSFVALDKADLVPANLDLSYRVLGIQGQLREKPANCSADGQTGCVATSSLAAIEASTLSAGIVRKSVQIGGITGDYPSARYPLNGAESAVTDLRAAGFTAALRSAAPFEYWDAAGGRHTGAGDTQLAAEHILNAQQIFGVAGTLAPSPAACSGDNVVGCVATTGFPAIEKAALSADNLRTGITIAGVTGRYPSAAAPLAGKNAVADMIFPSSLSGSQPFVFFDSAGTAHTVAAAVDLQPSQVLAGKTLLGVVGTASEAPGDCSAHNQIGCVASAGFPSYQAARLVPANIKAAEVIATPSGSVTGIYPSAAAPFASTSGVAKLSASTFASRLGSPAPFEFWDSAGTRHSLSGQSAFQAANILNTISLFGLQGTMRHQPANCSDTLSVECVATAAFPTYDAAILKPNLIKKGVRIGGMTGIFPSAAAPFDDASTAIDLTRANLNQRLSSTTAFEYWDATGQRFAATGDARLANQSNLRQNVTIFGRLGTAAQAPSACTGELQNGCLVQGDFKAITVSSISAAKIKRGVAVLGVTGTYPSAAQPLTDDTVATDLTSGNFDSLMASANSFEFFDAHGTQHLVQGSALLRPENIKDAKKVFAVTGNLKSSSGPCAAPGAAGCTATTSFPAYDKSALTEGVIKNGATVLGVAGKYPSSSYPMANGGFTGAELGANFNGALTSAATFEFWDSHGDRYEVAGDGDIQPANIRSGKTIFGVHGTLNPSAEIDPWDVLYGVNYTDSSGVAKSGKIKTNCRNMTDSQSSRRRLNSTTVYQNRNIDDRNGSRARMPNQNPFLKDRYECNGEAFTLVSPDPSSNADCGSSNRCIYLDRIAKVMWANAVSTSSPSRHSSALSSCRNLTWGGFNDWRLPTQKEALMAYVHGIRAISLPTNNSRFRLDRMTWTGTLSGEDSSTAYRIELSQGKPELVDRFETAYVHCIRSAD